MAEDLIVAAPARLVLIRTKTTAWLKGQSQKYGTPLVVLLLAAAIVITMTRNWNASEGGRVEQVTNDAYIRGDLTPLSTKVAGLVRDVTVTDYQAVHKGDELVRLVDDDYRAQVAQASAAVEAAKAALENNRRQRELQDTRIARAEAGIDQANAQIAAALAGKAAVEADVTRTRAERSRQEALLTTASTTQQKVEGAIADEQRLSAQASSRDADLTQARMVWVPRELSCRRQRATANTIVQWRCRDTHAPITYALFANTITKRAPSRFRRGR